MKNRFIVVMCTTAMCVNLFIMTTSAFTFDEVYADDISSQEMIEQKEVSDWAKSEIEKARQAGLITEHANDFMTRNTTRFQFAELVVNMVEKATGKTITAAPDTTFTDCKEIAVLKAKATGIVGGVGDNKFEPDGVTNREQIAAMIYRAITYIEQENGKEFTNKTADLSKFTDKDNVADFAVESVGILAANGIMNGKTATTLASKDPCTTEQSIILMYRLFNLATTIPVVPPTTQSKGYEKYPLVPDLLGVIDATLIKTGDATEIGSSVIYFIYGEIKAEEFEAYCNALLERGFVDFCLDTSKSFHFRHASDKDILIEMQVLGNDQVGVIIIKGVEHEPAQPLKYYPIDGAEAPDFGVATSCVLLETVDSATDNSDPSNPRRVWTHTYAYDEQAIFNYRIAYYDQIVESGYRYIGNYVSEDFEWQAWELPDGSWSIVLGFNYEDSTRYSVNVIKMK